MVYGRRYIRARKVNRRSFVSACRELLCVIDSVDVAVSKVLHSDLENRNVRTVRCLDVPRME